MQKCIDITKHFVKGDELFFGHYRTDGLNLTDEECIKYEKEINEHFKSNGRFEPIVDKAVKKRGIETYSGYLVASSLPINNETYTLLPKIFHYYLETIYFTPKISWETFAQSYRNYMDHGARGYIANGFTDFLFSYIDSGDFSLTFDSRIYEKDSILNKIMEILED